MEQTLNDRVELETIRQDQEVFRRNLELLKNDFQSLKDRKSRDVDQEALRTISGGTTVFGVSHNDAKKMRAELNLATERSYRQSKNARRLQF